MALVSTPSSFKIPGYPGCPVIRVPGSVYPQLEYNNNENNDNEYKDSNNNDHNSDRGADNLSAISLPLHSYPSLPSYSLHTRITGFPDIRLDGMKISVKVQTEENENNRSDEINISESETGSSGFAFTDNDKTALKAIEDGKNNYKNIILIMRITIF